MEGIPKSMHVETNVSFWLRGINIDMDPYLSTSEKLLYNIIDQTM